MADCANFIKDIFFHPLQTATPPQSVIGWCTLTTNQRNGIVRYAEGGMSYKRKTSTER
jgi:hypothetical protein